MREQRQAWHPSLADVPADKLVFVDESGAKTNMTRLYGWGAVGERVVDPVPHGHWKTCTMLAAVRLGGPLAAVTIDAAVDADAFVVWAREVLAPCLSPGDVVVMDNLPAHKVPGAVRPAGSRAHQAGRRLGGGPVDGCTRRPGRQRRGGERRVPRGPACRRRRGGRPGACRAGPATGPGRAAGVLRCARLGRAGHVGR